MLMSECGLEMASWLVLRLLVLQAQTVSRVGVGAFLSTPHRRWDKDCAMLIFCPIFYIVYSSL